MAFAEIYPALEHGILDGGVTVDFAAHVQRWYEVTDFGVGPPSSQPLTNAIVNRNRQVWDDLPSDIQQYDCEAIARKTI